MIDSESGRAQTLRFAIDLVLRITLLAGIVYGSLLLLSPIAGMLLWSAILAVAAHPLFALLRRRLHLYNALAAAVLSLLLLVLLFVPVAVLGASIVDTADQYARHLLAGGALLPPPPEALRDLPLVGQRLYDFWLDASKNIHALLSAHVGQIASAGRWMAGIAAGQAHEILQLAAPTAASPIGLPGRAAGISSRSPWRPSATWRTA